MFDNGVIGGLGAHPVADVLDAADAVFEQGQAVQADSLGDDELAEALARAHGLAAKQAELFLRLLAEADTRDLGRRRGASSTPAWIRDLLNMRPGTAKSSVDLAHRLSPPVPVEDFAANPAAGAKAPRSMPATQAALVAGEVSTDHAMVISRTMAQLPPDVTAEDATLAEEDLAAFAKEHDPATLQRLATHLLHVLAGESLEEREERARRQRRLRLVDLGDGTVRISGLLSNEDAATVRTALDPLAAPQPTADGERDPRAAEQRHADALVELCRRFLGRGDLPTRHGHPTQLLLLANLTTLLHQQAAAEGQGDHQTCGHANGSDVGGRTTSSSTAGGRTTSSSTAEGHTGERNSPGGDFPCGRTTARGPHQPGDVHDGSDVDRGSSVHFVDFDASRGHEPRRWLQDTWARRFGVAPAELTWGGPVSTGTARRLACDAAVTAVLVDQHGVPLRVGRAERSVTAGIWTALVARDRGCVFPACTRPPEWCHAHHIKHWADGGDTDVENLVLLCGHHHRVIHHGGWDVRLGVHGHPEFLPPAWIDATRTPRRNTRPRHHQQPPPAT
ncbi:HNH endonuclease signature motif containing protein [Phytoactinopolyspora limicola]|uniref:HNH endonuclease signature motif containing protein n=1 Tax=Phytoactinopolyspora limicola TaxID=2715536 RepID=UPI001A9CA55B|nr:HNH endonuclease signature motif containing protein [Phytoactinopolyspora limicola]